MVSSLHDEDVLTDSECGPDLGSSQPFEAEGESLASKSVCRTYQSCTLSPFNSEPDGNLMLPAVNNDIVQRKMRRDIGLPAFRFPQERVEYDVERIEVGVNQLLSLGDTLRDNVQELKNDVNTEKATNTNGPNRYITFSANSTPPLTASEQGSEETQATQSTHLQALQFSLTTIRNHLTSLETAISDNITSQLLNVSDTSDPSEPPLLNYDSSPTFKVEKENEVSVGAVLGTVKVACAVERGMEALVKALELGKDEDDDDDDEQADTLMRACLRRPNAVALEMRSAIFGMRKVLKSKGQSGRL